MVAVLLLAVVLSLLGLGLLVVVVGGSPRARRLAGPAAGLVVVLFGVAVPGGVLLANSHTEARQSTRGRRLTAYEQEGRRLFARNCATCHTLAAANSVGRVGLNLDDRRPSRATVLDAIRFGRARGRGQMPYGLLTGTDAEHVAAFVSAAAGR